MKGGGRHQNQRGESGKLGINVQGNLTRRVFGINNVLCNNTASQRENDNMIFASLIDLSHQYKYQISPAQKRS